MCFLSFGFDFTTVYIRVRSCIRHPLGAHAGCQSFRVRDIGLELASSHAHQSVRVTVDRCHGL